MLYDVFLRLKKNKFRRRKLLKNMNMCNQMMKQLDGIYDGDQDNSKLQQPFWEEWEFMMNEKRPDYISSFNAIITKIGKTISRHQLQFERDRWKRKYLRQLLLKAELMIFKNFIKKS